MTGRISIPALREWAESDVWDSDALLALVEAVEFLGHIWPSSSGAHEMLLTPEETLRGKRIVSRFDFGEET